MYNCAAAEAAAVGEAMTFFLIPTKNLAPPTAPDLVFRFTYLHSFVLLSHTHRRDGMGGCQRRQGG